MLNKIIFLFFASLLFTNLSHFAQAQKANPTPLGEFLHKLEQQFDVVFTYADENINQVYVQIPGNDLSLDEYIEEIQKQTGLKFTKLNARYIAIQKGEPEVIVTGVITDRQTKEALPGAVIFSGKTQTISNNLGQFSITLNPKADSILTVRYFGYRQRVINVNTHTPKALFIELTADILAIEEVTIDYLATGINKLKDGALEVNLKHLDVLPGLSEPDVLHAAQVFPGLLSINESVADINIRGGTNDQNLVLWDGVKMYQTGHFYGLISAFNSHLVNKSKIIKNGASVIYGEGVSGIIDMRQQEHLANKFSVSTGINMVSADVMISTPLTKKTSVIFGARHSLNNLVVTPTYKSYYQRAFEHAGVIEQLNSFDTISEDSQHFSFYDVSAKFIYDITNRDKITLSVLHINNNFEFEERATINDTLLKKNSFLSQASLLSNLEYKRNWNNQFTSHFSAFLSTYSLDALNADPVNGQNHLQKNEIIDWGLKLNTRYLLNENLSLLGGYQFNEMGIRNADNILKPDYERDAKDVLIVHSFYTEAEVNNLFDKAYLRFGVRSNYLPEFSSLMWEPRAVLNVELSEYISFEFLAERKSQYTTQLIDFQTDFLGIEKRRWVLSNNQSVPIIQSRHFSAGTQYNRNKLLLSVEAFTKEVTGIITPSQGFQNQFQYVYATGGYSVNGVEVLVNNRFRKSNLWLNYTFAKNDYYFSSLVPSTFPNNFDIRHSLTFGASYKVNQLEFSGGVNYRTGKPFTKPVNEINQTNTEIIYNEPNSSRLPDFVRLDISAKYRFDWQNVNGVFGFSLWNVLNRDNEINIFYYRDADNRIQQISQHALRITPNVNLRLTF